MSLPPFAEPDAPYYAPGWQPARPKTDGLAIAALVTAVVGLAPLGIGLGVGALVRTRRRGTRGRGLAIASIAVAVVWTLVAVALVAVAITTADATRPLPSDVRDARDAHAVQLVTGNCLRLLPTNGELDVVRVVPCSAPHSAEVISQFAFGRAAIWPGQAAADRLVARGCELTADEIAANRTLHTWAPTKESWDRGDRTGLCLLGSTGSS